MSREAHVRIRESRGVRLPRPLDSLASAGSPLRSTNSGSRLNTLDTLDNAPLRITPGIERRPLAAVTDQQGSAPVGWDGLGYSSRTCARQVSDEAE